jgi:NhaA family Na+:H+ antiporter
MKNVSFFLRQSERRPIDRILSPFQRFLHAEATGGILLFAATVVALAWANSPWAESYARLWQTTCSVGAGSFGLSKPLLLWINDGLMAVFFFVVGLEIKREVLVGELASSRQAALPVAGAVGGMVAPAAIYFAFNPEGIAARGWGVPMATDIAFSLGVLALLGKRVPLPAKVFLTAFAIVDDIGASVVIAVFYTEDISLLSLGLGGGVFALMLGANRLGIRRPLPYALLGVGLWLAFLKSGVHPTIAGVLGAMAIPARTRIDAESFLRSSKVFLDEFERRGLAGRNVLTSGEQRGALEALETACELAQAPLQRLEHGLHGWVSYVIMPIFALANAGVSLGSGIGAALASPVSLGVVAGLVIGKQLGVTLFAWVAVRLGMAELPGGLSWRHLYALAWLGGIGFTMSLFIASLAFGGDSDVLASAKVGILAGSLVSGVGGWLLFRRAGAARGKEDA